MKLPIQTNHSTHNSEPNLAKRINNALLRAEQADRVEENFDIDYLVPIVADGEAGFGGVLNVFELTKKFIEAGAAGIHFEDQLAAEKMWTYGRKSSCTN